MGVLVQVIATVILCFSCVNMSISMVWPSSTILLFQSENTTLHRPMTDMDVTLFSSLGFIGTLIAQPLMIMFVLDRQGLKRTAILSSMLFVIGWAIIAASKRVEAILLAVVFSGGGNATFLSVTMFVSEIAQDSIRGILTAATSFSLALGVLVSYFIGGLLEYHMMVYSYLTSAVIGVAMITILKESPVRLMAEGKEEEAVKSLAFYRQTSTTSKEVLNEIVNIQRSLNLEREDAQPLARLEEQTKPEIENKKMSCWQLFKSTPSIHRQFYLVLAIETAFVGQGMPFMQVYAEPIFTATVGDDISPNLCSVIFGLIMLVTGVISAYMSDEIGRRPLQIYSCLMCGVCSLCLGTQIVTEWFPNWTTLLFIYVFAIAYTVGAGTVSYVIVAEIFLPEVKSRLMMITNEWGWICSFSCMFLLSIMTQSLGYASAFFVFSIVSFATTAFYYFFLPETKALPVYAIQALFNKQGVK